MEAAPVDPVVDGGGIKNIGAAGNQLLARKPVCLRGGKRALMVCAMDRLGMAQALEAGCRLAYGDFPFVWVASAAPENDRLLCQAATPADQQVAVLDDLSGRGKPGD